VHACALPARRGEVTEPGSPVRWNNSGAITSRKTCRSERLANVY
jgi:hypothetical protein